LKIAYVFISREEALLNKTEALAETIRTLLVGQDLAMLATRTNGAPHTSLVAFKAQDDLRGLLFVTGRATRKFGYLQSDDRASMLIDNCSHRGSDFRRAMALTARGRAMEITGENRTRMLNSYIARFPCLEGFARAPGCALMCLRVEGYSLVRRFQDVVELEF
jgi:hypothetical protein